MKAWSSGQRSSKWDEAMWMSPHEIRCVPMQAAGISARIWQIRLDASVDSHLEQGALMGGAGILPAGLLLCTDL